MFSVLYSTLLHLPSLRYHCVGGRWDRTQDCSASALAVGHCNLSARSHPRNKFLIRKHLSEYRSYGSVLTCIVSDLLFLCKALSERMAESGEGRIRIGVLTVSDSCSQGEAEDRSGNTLCRSSDLTFPIFRH